MKYILAGLSFLLFTLSALAQDPNPPTGLSAATVSSTSINVTWTAPASGPSPDGYFIIVSTGATSTFSDGAANPTLDADITDGSGVASVAAGVTNYNGFALTPGTVYNFRVYSFKGTNYGQPSPTTVGYTFSTEPAAHAASFTSALNGSSQIDLTFSAASTITDADGYIILRKEGSAPDATDVDDGEEPDELTYPAGTTLVTVTNNSATTYSDTGLDGGITYHYVLIPYNFNGSDDQSYNYKTDGTLPTTSETTTESVAVAELTAGVAPDPLGSGTTNQAILGFSLTANAAIDFDAINIQLSSDPAGKLTNPRLFISTNNTFGPSDTEVAGVTVATTTTEFQFTSIDESLSAGTPKYYFIVVDVEADAHTTTPANLQPSFSDTDITISTGTIDAFTTIEGLDYTFADVTPPTVSTLNPADNTTGVALSTTQVVITFSEAVVNVGDNSDNNNRIRIFDEDAAATHESIDPQAAGRVTISGADNNVVTITLTTPLVADTEYSVRIGNSVFEDVAGNDFTGTTSSSWNFFTITSPTITSFTPTATCIGETVTITGTDFGTLAPDITINGVLVPGANVSAPTSGGTQVAFVIPAGATTGAITVKNNTTNLTSANSASNLTVHEAINTALVVTPQTLNPALNTDVDFVISNTQSSSYKYRLRLTDAPAGFTPAPPTNVDGPDDGTNGGDVTLKTPVLDEAGSYKFKITVSRTGCTTLDMAVNPPNNEITLTVAQLAVEAGNSTAICNGESVTLGGSPTASGGTTYYNIEWSTVPASGFSSNASNPVVSPTTTTTYRVSVKDTPSGTPVTDDVTITVNQPENANNLAILLNPSKPNNTYLNTDSPVDLTYTVSGVAGTFAGNTRFEGVGVNPFTNKFHPGSASLGVNNITLNYENASGCITQKTVAVEVRDQNAFITGLSAQYCEKNQNIPLSINQNIYYPPSLRIQYNFQTGIFELKPVNGYRYTYLGANPDPVRLKDYLTGNPIGSPAFSFSGNNITLNTNYTGTYYKYFEILYKIDEYAYNAGDPANPTFVGTRNEYVVVYVQVIPKPQLFDFIPAQICENASAIALNVSPSGGSFELNGSFNGPTFDPGTDGLPDNNTITYTYTDPNTTCTNSIDHVITINRLPEIDIDVEPGCVDEVIEITPVFNNPTNIPFDYFFDADGLQGYETGIAGNVPVPIQRTYSVPSNYPVNLQVRTYAGCVVDKTKPLTIGQVPDVSIQWANVCDGDNTRFSLKSNFYKNNINDVESVSWTFGDGNSHGVTNPVQSDSVHQYLYTATGSYEAIVTIRTDLNCQQSDTTLVYKVPKTNAIGAIEYLEDFNDANFEDQGWVSGGNNSSWAWGTPAGTLINTDASPGGGKAWGTSLTGIYNTNEDSWVHSPCFNLSEIERPVLSVDIRSLTRDLVDGAVLQYNTKNSTARESDWKTLGSITTGKNWYNKIGIGANPGNQTLLQTGWTGSLDSTEWRTAIIPLDNMLTSIAPAERDKVRFRFAFGSADFAPDGEGFSFDNFKISQRDRLVLVEQFTNSGGANSPTEPNKVANQAINNFMTSSSGEVIKLEYHLGVSGPNADPIYQDNPVDANARAAFYGVSSTPTAFVDARFGTLSTIFIEQTLKSTAVTIDTVITANTPADLLNVEVRFTAKNDLPANTVLHVAVIEKEIDDPEALGSNGEASFKYVMKKMLPDALGTRFTTPILSGTSQTVNLAWAPEAYDMSDLAIIVFLQNEKTKEIYQSAYKEPTYIPSGVVTGAEPDLASQIGIYPNPADRELNIVLPSPAKQATPMKLIDSFGREVHKAIFETGEQSKPVNTRELAGGVYIVQLETSKGVVMKKVMVVH